MNPDEKNSSLAVRIQNADKILYDGPAQSLSSHNDRGPFDILVFHENFISLIDTKIVVCTADGQKKEFPIDKGVLKAQENHLEIFLGIGK